MRRIVTFLIVAFLALNIGEQYANAQTKYTVKSGDTLWRISTDNNISVSTLKSLNSLKSNVIFVGQKLSLTEDKPKKEKENKTPSYSTYSIKSGDTLYGISREFKVSVTKIKELNNLTSNIIFIGQKLKVEEDNTPSKENEEVKEESKTENKETKEFAVVTADYLNFRNGPAVWNKKIGLLENGDKVQIVEREGPWGKVKFETKVGYIHLDYVKEIVVEEPTKEKTEPKNKIIVIDPGHGGRDSGAGAVDGYTYEKQVNLSISQKIKNELEEEGYTVFMTRDSDRECKPGYKSSSEELQCRLDFAEDKEGDLLLSVHSNWMYYSSIRGTETYYNARDDYDGNMNPYPEKSKKAATILHSHVQSSIGSIDRGVRNKSYYVNRMATMPSVLLEFGFLSNWSDLEKIKSGEYQSKTAKSIREGVNEYFGY